MFFPVLHLKRRESAWPWVDLRLPSGQLKSLKKIMDDKTIPRSLFAILRHASSGLSLNPIYPPGNAHAPDVPTFSISTNERSGRVINNSTATMGSKFFRDSKICNGVCGNRGTLSNSLASLSGFIVNSIHDLSNPIVIGMLRNRSLVSRLGYLFSFILVFQIVYNFLS